MDWHIYRIKDGALTSWIATRPGDTPEEALATYAEKQAKLYAACGEGHEPHVEAGGTYAVLRSDGSYSGLASGQNLCGSKILKVEEVTMPRFIATAAV